jgi:UDP-N-acetyl-D-galactosamine dehydrogenase
MGAYVAERVVKLLTKRKIHVVDANILVLGLAFKENCPDLRNTRVIDVINEFETYHANVSVYDPWVKAEEAKDEYGINLISKPKHNHYDAIILCVGHQQFRELGATGIKAFGKENSVLYDVKYVLPKEEVDERL